MCTRRSPAGEVEAEPVKLDVTGESCSLILDDGELLEFDAGELAATIEIEAAADRARAEAA